MGEHGYPDWQPPGTVVSASGESGALQTYKLGPLTGKESVGIFNVAGFSKTLLKILPDKKAHPLIVTVLWGSDEAMKLILGKREFVILPGAEAPTQSDLVCNIQNYGPFVQIEVEADTGLHEWETEVTVSPNNRSGSLECPIRSAVLIPYTSKAQASKTESYVYPAYHYSGPVFLNMYVTTLAGGVEFAFETWSPSLKNWTRIQEAAPSVQEKPAESRGQVPLGAWRLGFLNGSPSNVAAMVACVNPAPTGSN